MSIQAMSAAWNLPVEIDLSQTDLLILLRLGDWADDYGYSWPSLADLAEKVRVDPRTVRRRLAALETSGLLIRIDSRGGRGRTTLYRILPGILPDSESAPSRARYFSRFGKEDKMSPFPDQKGGHPKPERRTPEVRKEDTAMSSDPSGSLRDPSTPPTPPRLKRDLLRRIPVPKVDREGNRIRNPDAYRKKVARSPGVIEDLSLEVKAEAARPRGRGDLSALPDLLGGFDA